MLKVLTVVGTRPEAVKLVPVIRALQQPERDVACLVCSTGQHRQMLDQVLSLFDVTPDFDLDVMRPGQTPTQVASRVLGELGPILELVRPDWVVVQGDTTTVMAAAIAAHYARAKVAHVEAGLRSYDRANPFPEEMNRVVADHISDLHFAPTSGARQNLLREGIGESTIFVTGNTVIDALHYVVDRPCPVEIADLVDARHLILVTAHRRENHGQPLRDICIALRTLAKRGDCHIVYPVHKNPNIWNVIHQELGGVDNVTLLPPLDYLPMVHLMNQSTLILTDSGGVQEEAPSLGKPVLILREVTERPEAVNAGAARLVGTDPDVIVRHATQLLDDPTVYAAMAYVVNPFGDGRAAERIANLICNNGQYGDGLADWTQ